MQRIRRLILVAALATLAPACGKLHGGGQPDAIVIFNNQSLDQADVFAVAPSGHATRIGTVFAGRTEVLHLPYSALGGGGQVDIVARILARSRTPRTGPVSLLPGDRIEVTLPNDQRLLSVLPVAQP